MRSGGGTLWKRWNDVASRRSGGEAVVWVRDGEPSRRWSWGQLLDAARGYAAWLRAAGVSPGQVCAVVVRHHAEFYPLYMGIEAAGAIPAVLAYPNARLHPEKFRDGLRGMARKSGLDWVLTERELGPEIAALATGSDATVRGVLFPLAERDTARSVPSVAPDARENDPCLLQHSSGTTGLQKAVVLSHRAVLEHVDAYGRSIGISAVDKIVSWLPLYHDMGLIAALHLPLASGITTVQIDPFEWVQAPVLLLQQIASEGGTLTWVPNFALNLMADRIGDDELEGVRLDSLRMIVNCSEPVRAESQEKFAARFESYGLRRGALASCYAMAETTFAVSQSEPGQEPASFRASRAALSAGAVWEAVWGEEARTCVSSGQPIPGCQVRVEDVGGNVLPDNAVGELVVASGSLFDGYRGDAAKTAEVLAGGWFRTGDLGFTRDGEVFVIGRKKDIIIVAGKNLFPEDIEDAVSAVPGLLPGRVVAFGVDDPALGTETVAVVAETPIEEKLERDALRRRIVEAGMAVDAPISEVYLVPPRWLIKSSAGKPSRKANRERVGSLEEMEALG
jgi:fatty-acyl-CoA synthase